MKKSGVQIIVYNFMYLIISFVIFQMIVIYTKLNYDSIVNIIIMVGNSLTKVTISISLLIQSIYYYKGDKTTKEMNIFKVVGQVVLPLFPFILFTTKESVNIIIKDVSDIDVLLATALSTIGINITLRLLRKIILDFISYFKGSIKDEKDRILIVISFFGVIISLIALFK